LGPTNGLMHRSKTTYDGYSITSSARPTKQILGALAFHLVLESHDGRALVPIPKRSEPVCDIETAVADSLKVLDLKRPIREAT